jgi:hypothetical protein
MTQAQQWPSDEFRDVVITWADSVSRLAEALRGLITEPPGPGVPVKAASALELVRLLRNEPETRAG